MVLLFWQSAVNPKWRKDSPIFNIFNILLSSKCMVCIVWNVAGKQMQSPWNNKFCKFCHKQNQAVNERIFFCHQVQPRVWWVICIQCWKLVECFHVEKLRKLMRVSRCIFSAMMQNKKTVQYFCTATSITVAPLLSATQWLLLIALLSSSHCQQRPTLPLLML